MAVAYRFDFRIWRWAPGLSLGLLVLSPIQAKKLTLYHCQAQNGTVVVQDRACAVTRLPPAQSDRQQPVSPRTRPDKTPGHQPKTPQQAGLQTNPRASSQAFVDMAHARQWPAKINRNNHGWQLIIDVPKVTQDNQAARVSVEYFNNPAVTLNQDAFSYALTIYHGIRRQYRLIDSEFKSHPAYKVFNVAYQKSAQSAKSEFYIGKLDGSLWVFTLQSDPANLAKSRQIMAQLQALM